ncbi:MAG: AAA family ATPase [Chloroflexi bacterium]|nr:AAA family ATPase [Chloroflexota bacterium]MCC6891223.1 MoxR family ATPase [Anaerolineae bacterium]
MNSVQQLNETIKREASAFIEVAKETSRVIVGQERLISRLLIGLLCGGHILIEGVPGLAKTLSVRTLANTVQAKFQRIQFTPDLLPSDLVGTQVYNPNSGQFTPRLGPIFANIVLADEINRAPAKVQSALLEAMEERQVTIGDQTHSLPNPFMVLATQNPIEQEGTYPLPEAQLDRFMLKVLIGYPTRAEERLIVERMTTGDEPITQPVIDLPAIQQAQTVIKSIYVDEKIHDYVLNIIFMTRNSSEGSVKELRSLIEFGASPRATIALLKAAKALAFLRGRSYVTPDDIKQIAPDVLRHRILVTFEAQAESITSDQIIDQILSRVAVP